MEKITILIPCIILALGAMFVLNGTFTGQIIGGSGSGEVQPSRTTQKDITILDKKYKTCSDTDGGDNIFEAGILYLDGKPNEVHFVTGKPLSSDSCYDSRETGKQTAVEYFCVQNDDETFSIGYEERECPAEYICASGACMTKVPGKLSCEDSDGGKDIYKKGALSVFGNQEEGYEDFCASSSAIFENFCIKDEKGELIPDLEKITCPQGTVCEYGACTQKSDDGAQKTQLCKPDCTTCVNPAERKLGQACWKGECVSRNAIPTYCEDAKNPCRVGTRDQSTCVCKMRNKPDGTACPQGICSRGKCVAKVEGVGNRFQTSCSRLSLKRFFGLC